MSGFPVYPSIKKSYRVSSNQSKSRMYEVCFGKVDWGKNGHTKDAVFTRILLLKEQKWQPQNYPAHMLVTPGNDGKSDFDNVMDKIEMLRKEYLFKK